MVHVAAQLGIADPGVFKGYAQRRSSQWEHAEQIRTAYGYRDFSDPDPACCSTGPPPASSRTKCCYPDPACERLITTVREQATQQLHTELAALPDGEQRHHLNGLLSVEETTRTSRLERLRRGPTSVTAAGCSVPWTGWARCASSVWMSWTYPRCHPAALPPWPGTPK